MECRRVATTICQCKVANTMTVKRDPGNTKAPSMLQSSRVPPARHMFGSILSKLHMFWTLTNHCPVSIFFSWSKHFFRSRSHIQMEAIIANGRKCISNLLPFLRVCKQAFRHKLQQREIDCKLPKDFRHCFVPPLGNLSAERIQDAKVHTVGRVEAKKLFHVPSPSGIAAKCN